MIAGRDGDRCGLSPPLLAKRGIGWTLAFACGLSSAAFVYLAFVSPPFLSWWRVFGLVLIGLAAGVLHTAIFHAISPMYRHDPAATINLAGMLFGLGCLTVALLISGTFYAYTAPAILAWLAVIPGLFGWLYVRARFTPLPIPDHPPLKAVFAELRSPGAVLFSLLLFFQFGNEWAIAGWLPMFLSQRLGISPATSILMLAMYWFALLIGRVVAQWILPRARHGRILGLSVLASMLGCVLLMATDNRSGAIIGILLVGGSFAPIYPLVVEKIGNRFPYYHPGILQRDLFSGDRGRIATPKVHVGIFRVGVGHSRSHGLAAGRFDGGVRAADFVIAGSPALSASTLEEVTIVAAHAPGT